MLSDSYSYKEAGRDATNQADGYGTSALGTPLQDHPRSTLPRPMPSGLDGESGAEAQEHCARFRGASHDCAAVAAAVSGTGRGGFSDPLGARGGGAHSRDLGANDPGLGERWPPEL